MKRIPVISLIGRPNVGKSTLFNRLVHENFRAMAFDQPGVTRDRHYAIANVERVHEDKSFDLVLVDTGGFYPEQVKLSSDKVPTKVEKRSTHFFNIMADQAKLAIEESDLVLFVVDVREGLIPFDESIWKFLLTTKKPALILANKYDTDKQAGSELDFYNLGIDPEQMITTSAEHARGIQDVQDYLFEFCERFQEGDNLGIQRGVTPNYPVVGNMAIIGAPNAGKSTLLNTLVGAERALVSPMAGTTVDPIEAYIDVDFKDKVVHLENLANEFRKSDAELVEEITDSPEYKEENFFEDDFDQEMTGDDLDEAAALEERLEAAATEEEDAENIEVPELLEPQELEESPQEKLEEKLESLRSIKIVDTAGIRRKSSVSGFVEEQSVYRSLKAVALADVVVLVVDISIGITHHDQRLCDIALEKGKSLILCLNKIDLAQDILNDQKKKREWLLDLRAKIRWLDFCEIVLISAKHKRKIGHLVKAVRESLMVRKTPLKTSELNSVFKGLVEHNPIVLQKSRGVHFRVKYASMIKGAPPTFILFCNKARHIPVNYRRYLQKGVRRAFDLKNTPIHLIFRTTTDLEKRMKKLDMH